jgi:dTDP-4-amino-4,6-dideoxygalactose transaminase
MVGRFESRLATVLGLAPENLVCIASGTIGLTLSLRALEAPPGSFCLMPSWTFPASPLAVKWAGMAPCFLDVDESTWTLDPEKVLQILPHIEDVIGAVMPVSAFGAPVDVAAWDEFERETGIPVVIDAAAGFDGAEFGHAPMVISLHATKAFGIGEGALIASRDLTFAARIRAMSNFGFSGARESALIGINAKVSEYAAAVGMAALDCWPGTRSAFRRATGYYEAAFADVGGVVLAPGISRDRVRSTLSVRLTEPVAGSLMAALAAKGIASRQWWGAGCHRMPAFENAHRLPLTVTEILAQSVVGLPFSQDICEQDVCDVRDAVVAALNG